MGKIAPMSRACLLAVIAVAAIAASAGPAAADGATHVPRVGIVIGVTVNVDQATADALGDALAAALVDKLEVDAISGIEVTRRLPATGLPDECVSTPVCIADLGQRLSADQLLFLAVVQVGDHYQVDTTFIDVVTGALVARPRVQVVDVAQATKRFADQASRFLPDARVRPSATPNQTVIVHADAERHRPIRPAVWALGGAGIAALGTGIAFGLSAKAKYDGCNGDRICSDADKRSIHTRSVIADISMGVGLACAVAAVVVYVKTPLDVTPLVPEVTPVTGGAVLSFDGRF